MRLVGIDPTGSTWDRTAACPASAALPQVFNGHASDPRDKGTALHKFVDRIAEMRRETPPRSLVKAREIALEEVDEQWRPACEQLDVEALGHRTTLSTEVAVAYDWVADTARILTPIAPRQYEVDPDREVAQTLDVCGVGDRTVTVGDYKGPYAWLPDPSRSLQLGGGALALARVFKARTAHVEFIRLRTDGTIAPWRATLDTFALEGVRERIQAMMRDVAELRGAVADGATPNVTEGPWCGYCPARTHCPAKTALVRSVLAGDARTRLSLREPITPDNVGDVYRLLRKVKEGVSLVEKAVRAYEADGAPSTPDRVSESAIPVGVDEDGSLRYFGRFEREGNEKIDGDIALDVLQRIYGDTAIGAFEVSTSKDAIEKLIRANKPPGQTLKDAKAEAFDRIRAAGGASRAPTDKPTEFLVSPDGKAKKATTRKKAS